MATAEAKQIDLRDVFNLLESTETHITEDIRKLIQDNLSSTRESWLVNSLVDYYYTTRSQSVVAILTDVSDPHDKHLLEKLQEGLKGGDHQLPALQFLLSLVCRPPRWVNKLVHLPVLKVIIKLLKAETNIPVLMTAVSIVTILLPSIPTLIGPYLPDVFEIFNRLASFSVRKPTGNIPDVFILHLQVAVYALFHRLYGMFPYNFLAYLRYYYNKKDNIVVFDEVVKSMLERVRLHPSLITSSTKEQEMSTQRWRQMETQDIVVECARLSLDPIEGTWEELHCPIISSRFSLDRKTANQEPKTKLAMPTGASCKARLSSASKSDPIPTHPLENYPFWSPSEVIGLSTPPPSQRNTPATSFVDSSFSIQHHAGASFVTPQQLSTPTNTPRETPIEDPERALSQNTGRIQTKSTEPKPSADLTIITNVPILTPSSHNLSIPPSPMKQEFTNTPPLCAVKSLPILHAARELQFDTDQSHEGISQLNQSNVRLESHVTKTDKSDERNLKLLTKVAQSGTNVGNEAKQDKSEGKVVTMSDSDVKYVATGAENLSGVPSSTNTDTIEPRKDEAAVFIDNLQEIVQIFDSHEEDDNDAEVSELTSSTRSTSVAAMLTAESVALFMKSVNRIRFNSLTASNGIEQYQNSKIGMKNRSRSCPQLPKIDPTCEDEEHISRSASTMIHESSLPGLPVTLEEEPSDFITVATTTRDNVCDLSITSTSSTVTVSTKQETSDTMATAPSRQQSSTDQGQEGATRSASCEEYQLTQLLTQLLDPYPTKTCSKCRAPQQKTEEQTRAVTPGNVRPMFSTFSPPELLDRHLRLGGDIHAKELSKIPIPSTQNVNWTHFGGVPPADEISILRTQQMLLHNQLLYERHKREQHAMRNRRLLRKIVNAKILEEQNKAMTDQLRLNENTIHNLQVSLKLLQADNRKLRSTQDSQEYEKLVQLRACLQENEDLKSAKKEFNTLLVRQREEQDGLSKKLMSCEAKLLNTSTELEAMRQHAEMNVKLKEQVIRLQKELLLMGELQQKSQEKLQSYKISNSVKHEQDYQLETLRADIKVLEAELERKTVQHDACQHRLHDRQDLLSQREMSLAEVKRNLETVKTSHDDELRCVEDKHQAVVRINQGLEFHLLKLYAEIEELQSRAMPAPSRRRPHNSGTPPDGAGPSNHGNSNDQSEPRDRTNSDPLRQQQQKSQLMRMGSAPPPDMTQLSEKQLPDLDTASQASTHRDQQGQKSFVRTDPLGMETQMILEAVDPSVLERRMSDDPNETVSMSSRDSSVFPHNQNLLYTDSEDSRSVSNRSNALSDSGFC